MNLNHYPAVWPDMIPALEAALLGYEESIANMAHFKKKYTAVKNKVKRIEKYLVSMDEESRKICELIMLNNVRLAENKFILINKRLNRFKQQEQHTCKKSLTLLKSSTAMDRNITLWHIQKVAAHLANVNNLLREVTDMLRIAKGHLAKVDHTKKYMAQIRRRKRLF